MSADAAGVDPDQTGGSAPLQPKQQTLLKSSMVMASGTLVSRLLGFVRSALLVAALGSSAGAMASFQVANTLPNMVYNLLAAGIIDAVLIPQIVRALKGRAGNEYVNKLLTAAGTLLFLLTMAAMVATPVIVTILASAFSPAMRALTITFALICVPQIFFYGLYNLLGELLNARGIFGPYMWAPVVNNVVGIASLILFLQLWGRGGAVRPAEDMTAEQIALVAGLATVGVIAQALILLVPMRKSGLKLRLDFRFRGTNFGSASKVAFWAFATLMLAQLGVVSTSQLATRADAYTQLTGTLIAGNPAYQYAFMIYMVPQSLIALTLATAIFTRLASDVADGDIRGVARHYHQGVELIVLLSAYAAAVLVVAATPIMQIIMPTLPSQSASLYGMVLVALIVALPSTGLNIMSQRLFFALENARPVFLMSIVPLVLQIIIGWSVYFFAEAQWWTVGAASGETASRIVQGFIAVVWVGVVVRQVNVGRIVVFYLRSMLAFAISALAAWGILHLIGPTANAESTLGRFLDGTWKSLIVTIIVTVVYFGFLRFVDPVGTKEVFGALVARLRPAKQTTAPLPPGEEVTDEDELEEAAPADEPEDEEPEHLEASAVGREMPQATTWADAPPQWDDLFDENAVVAAGAAYALNRNISMPDMGSTGAIPVISGPIPMVEARQIKVPVEKSGTVESDTFRKDTELSHNPSPASGSSLPPGAGKRKGSFNPTIPALVIGLLLLIVAGVFAWKTAMDSNPSALFSDLDGPVAMEEQSGQSGDAEEESAGSEETVATPVVTSATIFSWSNDDGDHPELVSSLLDGDPTTTWRSRYFVTNTFDEGTEIAILLTLAEPAVVSEVTVDVVGQGGEIVIRDASDGDPRSGAILASAPANGSTVIKLAQPSQMSAVGIVFSSLPVDDEGMNRAKVTGISVR